MRSAAWRRSAFALVETDTVDADRGRSIRRRLDRLGDGLADQRLSGRVPAASGPGCCPRVCAPDSGVAPGRAVAGSSPVSPTTRAPFLRGSRRHPPCTGRAVGRRGTAAGTGLTVR